jgi:hypothetical protein
MRKPTTSPADCPRYLFGAVPRFVPRHCSGPTGGAPVRDADIGGCGVIRPSVKLPESKSLEHNLCCADDRLPRRQRDSVPCSLVAGGGRVERPKPHPLARPKQVFSPNEESNGYRSTSRNPLKHPKHGMPATCHGHPAAPWMATRGFFKGGVFHGRDLWLSDGKDWIPMVKRARLGSLPRTGLRDRVGQFAAKCRAGGTRIGRITSECAVIRPESACPKWSFQLPTSGLRDKNAANGICRRVIPNRSIRLGPVIVGRGLVLPP